MLASFHLQLWKHYNAGTLMELLDPNLRDQCSEAEALKVFQVGLLCAQVSLNLGPSMWKVVDMLGSGDRVLLWWRIIHGCFRSLMQRLRHCLFLWVSNFGIFSRFINLQLLAGFGHSTESKTHDEISIPIE